MPQRRVRAVGFAFLLALVASYAAAEGPGPVEIGELAESPAVAATRDGFVVVWEDRTGVGPIRIVARLVDGQAMPLAPAFSVSDDGSWQTAPAVAGDAAGAFVVAWESDLRTPVASFDVWFRRFGAGGRPRGETTRAGSRESSVGGPAIAMEPWGGFALLWRDWQGLWSRRFLRDGTPTRRELLLTARSEETFAHSVAFAGGERPTGYAAAWSLCLQPSCFRDAPSLRFLRPGGKPAGPVDFPGGELRVPRVLTGAEGEVLIVGSPGFRGEVTAQRRTADGRPLESPRVLSRRVCGGPDARDRELVVDAAFLPPRRLAVLRSTSIVDGEGSFRGTILWLEVLDALRGGTLEPCRRLDGGEGESQLGVDLVYGRQGQLLATWVETIDPIAYSTPGKVRVFALPFR